MTVASGGYPQSLAHFNSRSLRFETPIDCPPMPGLLHPSQLLSEGLLIPTKPFWKGRWRVFAVVQVPRRNRVSPFASIDHQLTRAVLADPTSFGRASSCSNNNDNLAVILCGLVESFAHGQDWKAVQFGVRLRREEPPTHRYEREPRHGSIVTALGSTNHPPFPPIRGQI
jgi:hypothetical protein